MTAVLDRPDVLAAFSRPTRPRPTARRPQGHAVHAVHHPHAPGLEVAGAQQLVPLATGGHIAYANFDHAASAPALTVVRAAVEAVLDRYASVHRGAGWHSKLCTALYEGARGPVRSFVGGRPDDAVIFTRNTTDSFALLAHCLPRRTTVVVFETEHHVALLPWERRSTVVRLPAPASHDDAVAAVDDALRRRAPGPALLVMTGASNVTGEMWPIDRLSAVARSRGARIALDAAQLAPHRPFSITDLDVDYVALSGHKLYAPYGAGALIGRADWLAAAPAYLLGGGATAVVGQEITTYAPLPARHEAGTPNVIGAVALATACHALAETDRDLLSAKEAGLTDRLRTGLAAIPGVRLHRLFAQGDTIGVITFTVDGLPAATIAAALSAEHGIGVRDGAFCAQPLVRHLLARPGAGPAHTPSGPENDCGKAGSAHAVRASIGLGTTSHQVDRLVDAVARIAADGPGLTYIDRDGRPVPAVDARQLPRLVAWQ